MSEVARVELENCHHVVTFTNTAPPMIGEEIWCIRCEHMRKVKNAPAEYRIRCLRCTYARRVGNARLTAETKASSHANRKQHPVAVYNGRKRIYVVGEHFTQRDTPLPGFDLTTAETSDPPF